MTMNNEVNTINRVEPELYHMQVVADFPSGSVAISYDVEAYSFHGARWLALKLFARNVTLTGEFTVACDLAK